MPNLKTGAVGVEEEEARLWEKRFLEVDLDDFDDLVGDFEGDLEGEVAGDLRAEKEDLGEVGLSSSFELFSLSLSFLKMWASWTIGGR